jgi:stringent starvation protein B
MAENSSPKYFTLKRLLEEEYVLVHINTGSDNLALPSHLMVDETVSLKLSRYFRGAMEVTTEKITAELLFNGSYNSCVIPLAAIWGCHSQRGNTAFWPESAPEGVVKSIMASASQALAESNDTAEDATEENDTHDETSSAEAISSQTETTDQPTIVTKLKTRSHLKRVK